MDNKLLKRFWSKVNKRSNDECWEWTASKDKDGYGYFWIKEDGECRKAHRVSWYIHHGYFPSVFVCHHCDNPSCVNPNHLFLGTARDNNNDKVNKGRLKKVVGSKHGNSKLKEEEVLDIKRRVFGGDKQKDLARIYGVSEATISLIANNKNWRWLSEGYYNCSYTR